MDAEKALLPDMGERYHMLYRPVKWEDNSFNITNDRLTEWHVMSHIHAVGLILYRGHQIDAKTRPKNRFLFLDSMVFLAYFRLNVIFPD